MKLDHTKESLSAIRLTPSFKAEYLALQEKVKAHRTRKAEMEAFRIETSVIREELSTLLDKILTSPRDIETDNIVRACKLRAEVKKRDEEFRALWSAHEDQVAPQIQLAALESQLIFIVFGHEQYGYCIDLDLVVNLGPRRVRENKNEPGSPPRPPRCDQ